MRQWHCRASLFVPGWFQAFARSASQQVVAPRVGAPRCKEPMRATVTLPWWNSDKVTSSWSISQDNHPNCLVHMAATRMLAQPRFALNPLWRTSGVYVEDFRREESWCFGRRLGEVYEEQFQGSPTESFVLFVNKWYEIMKLIEIIWIATYGLRTGRQALFYIILLGVRRTRYEGIRHITQSPISGSDLHLIVAPTAGDQGLRTEAVPWERSDLWYKGDDCIHRCSPYPGEALHRILRISRCKFEHVRPKWSNMYVINEPDTIADSTILHHSKL